MCRSILENFAKEYVGFDATKTAEPWYGVTPDMVDRALESKQSGLSIVLRNFDGSIVTALLRLYPDYSWEPWRFQVGGVPSGYWKTKENRRRFFDWLANKLGFKSKEDFYKVNELAQLQKVSQLTLTLQRKAEST